VKSRRAAVTLVIVLIVGVSAAIGWRALSPPSPAPPPRPASPPPDPIDSLSLLGTAPLSGLVRDGNGEPVSGARIDLYSLLGSRIVRVGTTESGEDGGFALDRVPVSQAAVVVTAPGLARAVELVDVERGGVRGVEVSLPDGAVVAGRVVADGAGGADAEVPVALATVCARPHRGSAVPELDGICAPTDAEGRFEIQHLSVGLVAVAVEGEGISPAVRPEVVAPASALLLRVAPLGSMSGTVRRPDGTGAPGARVIIAGSGIWPPRTLETGDDGVFVAEGVPRGLYELEARWESLASRRELGVEVGSGERASVDLDLDESAEVVGRVIDRRTAAPIAGATVTISSDMASVAPERTATDSEGRFRVGHLAPGQYWLGVDAEGHVSVTGRPCAVPSEVEVSLEPEAVVRGRVVDSRGFPVEGALVEPDLGQAPEAVADAVPIAMAPDVLLPADGPTGGPTGELGVVPGLEQVPIPLSSTDPSPQPSPEGRGGQALGALALRLTLPPPRHEGPDIGDVRSAGWPVSSGWDGAFTIRGLPSGRFALRARHDDMALGRSAELVIATGQTVDGVEIVLERGVELAGRVIDGRGFPLEGVLVRVESETSTEVAVTSAGGEFSFGAIAGSIQVLASREGYADAVIPLDMDRARVRQDVEIRLETASRRLRGRVVDDRGYPVAGATVMARAIAGGRLGVHHTFAASDGTFELEGLSGDTIAVEARSASGGTGASHAGPDDEAIEIAISASGSLAIAVVDSGSGAAVPSCVVDVLPALGSRRREECLDGTATVSDLPAGLARVQVEAPGYADAEAQAEVAPGSGPGDPDARLEVELSSAVVVTGTVVDSEGEPVPGARISLAEVPRSHLARGIGPWVTSEAGGAFSLPGVPCARTSSIHVVHALRGSAVLEVGPFWPQDEPEVEVVLDQPPSPGGGRRHFGLAVDLAAARGAVTVVRVAPSSAAETAGLRPGDRITAIDGQPVTGLATAIRGLRGPRGTALFVTFSRDTETYTLAIERELVVQ
jgi:protocatechuate 3,4-dioxygenase beta subunit